MMTIRAVRMPKTGLSDTLLIGISAPSHALTTMSCMIMMIMMMVIDDDHDHDGIMVIDDDHDDDDDHRDDHDDFNFQLSDKYWWRLK